MTVAPARALQLMLGPEQLVLSLSVPELPWASGKWWVFGVAGEHEEGGKTSHIWFSEMCEATLR